MLGLPYTFLLPRIHLQSNLPCHLSQFIWFCAPEQGTDPEAVMHLGRIFPFWVPAWVGPRWVMIQIEMNIGAAQALGFDL